MTSPLTRQHLPILHHARHMIETGETVYLCNAVDFAAADLGFACDNTLPIRLAILKGLADVRYPCSPRLELWLAHHLGVKWSDIPRNTLTLARLAWIDRLIANIEEQTC